MKTLITIIICIAALIWIAEPVITLKPLSISFNRPYFSIGWLFVLIGLTLIYFQGLKTGRKFLKESVKELIEQIEAEKTKPIITYNTIEINDELLNRAIYVWGNTNQVEMIKEECIELALALQKYNRVKGDKEKQYNDIIDEIADVTIMIKQAHIIFPLKLINDRIDFKMKRLEKRLEKSTSCIV